MRSPGWLSATRTSSLTDEGLQDSASWAAASSHDDWGESLECRASEREDSEAGGEGAKGQKEGEGAKSK